MKKLGFLYIILLVCLQGLGQIEPTSKWILRGGPAVAFATQSIAMNEAGIGLIAGVEKHVYKILGIEAEAGFIYFIGDKTYSIYGKNKAYAIPFLAGLKTYVLSQVYVTPRLGIIYFHLNDLPSGYVRPAYGLAAGVNLPRKTNRINIQAGYTGFRKNDVQRGYATLAAGIIIK